MQFLQKIRFLYIMAGAFMSCAFAACANEWEQPLFVMNEVPAAALENQGFSLIVSPRRYEYPEGSDFAKTEEHLLVYVVDSAGATQKAPLDEIEIVLEDTPLTSSEPYTFQSAGEKVVTVKYKTLTAWYTIIVRSGTDNVGSGSTSHGGTTVDIGLKWD